MANQTGNGRNPMGPDENRPSWRPFDEMQGRERESRESRDYHHDERDRERGRWSGGGGHWEDDRSEMMHGRDTDRGGMGQSGYSAGRQMGDRSMQQWNRNPNAPSNYDREAGGLDDRFAGRGYWQDQSERRGGYNPERQGVTGGYGGGSGFEDRMGQRPYGYSGGSGYEDRGGYWASDEQRGWGRGGDRPGGQQGMRGYGQQNMYGYGQQPPYNPTMQRGSDREFGHRGKGPKGYTRSDERIRELVSEALADDDQVDASEIEVQVKNGEVILLGSVNARYMKRLAEDVVERVPGVHDVQNQIRVTDRQSAARGNQTQSGTVSRTETETSAADKRHRA
jgi:hypothetical protein